MVQHELLPRGRQPRGQAPRRPQALPPQEAQGRRGKEPAA